jgi:hypothetical protein
MGSRRSPTLYKLIFDETTDWPDLEVVLRSMSIRRHKELTSARAADETEDGAFERMLNLIVSQLVSWNREDEDGEALPATRESLEDEEPKLIHALIAKWNQAIVGVPTPLESDSADGEISPAESMLTEIPSESLAS